ncbi:NepR family anti-sigma factor [Methylobacterium sp. NEAU K]|uniref:NepR family anti-sigma factor n=1 Tax=Methylobacterium sp. NEAU K TaxID=3064946 RepID=UPI00273577C4|nr:NepR family anti-sigma factor [Methylobacterium sp. NEAU K]MDP4005275.1 NepR family anti-sigma factor [Methylobacterium sp. NEAU K]
MSQDEEGQAITGSAIAEDGAEPALSFRTSSGVSGAATGRRPIDAAGRARIGRGLRLHYAEVLALPIPERLRTLIDDLAACSDTEAQR